MKRIIAALLLVIMAFSFNVYAEETGGGLIVTTVRVNMNEGTVTKNDEILPTTTAPYINEAGVSMIEFYTLADALGAEAYENGDTIKLTYAGVEMQYTLNVPEAVISDNAIPMPSAPVRSENGVIMVPIRFISEAMGADVTYDGGKGEIVITSSGEMDEGINFKLLFKYSAKDKIGHSGQHWRFTKTDNFDMTEDTWSSSYMFAMDDIVFTIMADKNEDDMNVERIYSLLQQSEESSYYGYQSVIYAKGTGEHNGVPYAYVKTRTMDTIMEAYGYVTDEYVYYIGIERSFESFATAKDNQDVNDLIASLEFNYNGGEEDTTVDLANVNLAETSEDEKKEEYTDGNYSWSVSLNDTWTVDEYYGFYNKVTIRRSSALNEDYGDDYSDYYSYMGYSDPERVPDSVITVTTLSNPDNQSVGKWAQEKHEICEKSLNPQKCTVSAVQDVTINGYAAKVFEVTEKNEEYTTVHKYYYLNSGKYRYELVLTYDSREAEQGGFTESADAVIKSFKPGEINAEEVGDALEADSDINMLHITSEYEGERFTVTYPCIWYVSEDESSFDISTEEYSYGTSSSAINVTISENSLEYYDDELNKKYYLPEEYMKKSIAKMLNSSSSYYKISMVGEIENIKLMGRDAYKVVLTVENTEEETTIYFIPDNSESIITLTKECGVNVKNTVYEQAMDKAIESIKITE